jgi:hypothetical protein
MYTTPVMCNLCVVDTAGGSHQIFYLDAMRYVIPYVNVR